MLEILINQNELKLQHIIKKFNHSLINMNAWVNDEKELFYNINSKLEFDNAINITVCR